MSKYVEILEALCNTREDLIRARNEGSSKGRIKRLENAYISKRLEMLKYIGTTPDQKYQVALRALESLKL